MRSNKKTKLLIVLAAPLLLIACRKEGSDTSTAAERVATVASADVEADVTFTQVSNDVSNVNDDIGIAGSDVGNDIVPADSLSVKCYSVTISPATAGVFPKTVTIDFGSGCLCKDGRTRKGKIISVFTGRLKVPGAKATTSFDGYYVNDVHVEGTLVVENNSTADIRRFTRTVTDGKLSKSNGNNISWNASHVHTQTAGLGTPNYHWDDEFETTGSATGITIYSGNTYNWTRTIGTALHKKVGCKWFDKGTVTITHNARTGTLDFGDGGCDNKATITINGISKEITLP